MGKVKSNSNSSCSRSKLNSYTTSFLSIENSDLNNINETLKRFWEIEEIPTVEFMSPDDECCEKLFTETCIRTSSGRYQVDLPFRESIPTFNFENARSMALQRFYQLEKKLINNSNIKTQYDATLNEYLSLDYLEEVPSKEIYQNSYYIPHHCVVKPNKFRIVYDASAKVNDLSLNDHLLVGAKLQKDIIGILLNFRLHKVVFTCDIKAMFPQILINTKHQDFLRILYRFSNSTPVKDYRLKRVTFGVSSSPFLANRTILKLANDERVNFPLGADILENYLYVDDCCAGSSTLDNTIEMRNQLIAILKSAGFELRKWSSNNSEFLSDFPPDYIQSDPLNFTDHSSTVKILGLSWQPSRDIFHFNIDLTERVCSKRHILSDIARIYDPLGFLTPIIVFLKQLLQTLWVLNLNWDAQPPNTLVEKWLNFKTELKELHNLAIPRLIIQNENEIVEIHGFCDASIKAYAAVVYIRVLSTKHDVNSISLLISKSKIAPIKPISIPRLELCAAVLLAELLQYVKNVYHNTLKIKNIYAWSDSIVVLTWINSLPHRWPCFIANRVCKIQNVNCITSWFHVKSTHNPADCASRGLSPSNLLIHKNWWYGPEWLRKDKQDWPLSKYSVESVDSALLEERKVTLTIFPVNENIIFDLLNRFNSIMKIQRIITYILRFIHNSKSLNKKQTGPCTYAQLEIALFIIIKFVQNFYFADDITQLKIKKPPSKYLRKLSAFLDDKNILRVGGRLAKSELDFNIKYPILLPRNGRFTILIIQHYHKQNLHPGLQQTHFLLLQKFWILSPKRTIKSVISKCQNCWRLNPQNYQPKMADLPKLRISNAKPFVSIAIDFCGYFSIKPWKTRNSRVFKAYVCVFICLATKAIHLEFVSDLSSDAFLGAFRRFMARRGRCTSIISDCGTNFVGASKFLLENCKRVAETEDLQWNFNPPAAPHFSGLVEAGVKSFKTHLKRVIGEQVLTVEEFHTLIAQIEAILNSRPLSSISSDPNDLNALTPGHFLTLEPLVASPDVDLTNIQLNRLNRWQLIQRMQQDFWTRWKNEYLHTLQQRSKWFNVNDFIPREGDLVVVKTEGISPLKWPLGRIISIFKGTDGVPRVANIRTKQGTYKRPLVKLCPLPLEID